MSDSRRRAQKHAEQLHVCPLCGKKCWGNGGWASHRRAHLRAGTAGSHAERWARSFSVEDAAPRTSAT